MRYANAYDRQVLTHGRWSWGIGWRLAYNVRRQPKH
jgi:hypothetical protein